MATYASRTCRALPICPALSPRVDIPLTRSPRFANAIPRDDARCIAAWPCPSNPTRIRPNDRPLYGNTGILHAYNEFFSLFKANASAGPNVDQPPHAPSDRKKI
jgi:hypothetical protein